MSLIYLYLLLIHMNSPDVRNTNHDDYMLLINLTVKIQYVCKSYSFSLASIVRGVYRDRHLANIKICKYHVNIYSSFCLIHEPYFIVYDQLNLFFW